MQQLIEFLGNHPMLSAAWVGLFFAIIYTSVKIKFSAVSKINTQELTLLVNRENAVVVDIRSINELNKGHIASSVHLPNEKAKTSDFSSLDKYKNTPIIVVCATGLTASVAAENLHKAGFASVSVLSGGIGAWQNANLPVTK